MTIHTIHTIQTTPNRTPITTALIQTMTAMLIRKKNTIPKNPIKTTTIATRDPLTILAGSPVTITTGPNVQRIDILKEIKATATTTALLLLPATNPSKPT